MYFDEFFKKLNFFKNDIFLLFRFQFNANKASEDAIRAYEAKMKPIWDAEKAAKAAKENREGMIKYRRVCTSSQWVYFDMVI